MLTGPSSRAEQLIYQRRAAEQKVSAMQTKLKQEFHQSEFAKWQNKGKNIEIKNQVKQRLASLRQSSNLNLNARRYLFTHVGRNWPSSSGRKIRSISRKSSTCRRPQSRCGRGWPSG